jgi:DNA-binding LacI/PurR family transcriptional regulator
MPRNKYSLITCAQLAKICNVSQGTVDRAINNRAGINAETKKRILEAARTYGYSPNVFINVPVDSKSQLLGIVLFDLNNDYFSRFTMDFEVLCQRIGYNSVVMFSHNDKKTEIGCINQLVHLGVDGIVLCPVGKGKEYSLYLNSLDIPVVTIGNRIEGVAFAGINDMSAMRGITKHAISLGFTKFIYYAPVLKKADHENIYAQTERYRGFVSLVEACDYPYETVLDEETLKAKISSDEQCAVICPSDIYAISIYNLVRDKNLKNIKVFGFDNCDILDKARIKIDSISYDRNALIEQIHRFLNKTQTDEVAYIPYTIAVRK